MRGTITHRNEHNATYSFVEGEDGKEYILRDSELEAWTRDKKLVGFIIEFKVRATGSRKPDCRAVEVVGRV
jgi:hypothetical protein